ncbi:MAG TPA: hypothetical protein VJQ45_08090 [Ktedonobacterales bacterium]|nr:hypothetical protein [Ktedonobacterales bacterium]
MSERRQRATPRQRATAAGDWRMRMRRAADMLDDTRLLAELALRVRAVDLREQPAAAVIAGRQTLATARAVGLFAGSFNPLTQAHVALADGARAAGQLDVIAWTLAVETVNKERVERATLPDRLAQLEAFRDGRVGRSDAIVVANRGLYVDQARALHALMAPKARLAIVIGYDKVVQIFDPRYYADRDAALAALFDEADLLVAPRAGQGPRDLEALLARPENAPFAGAVHAMPLAPEFAAESSSQVRTLAAAATATAPRKLVTPEGWALARRGAYATADESSGVGAAYAAREAWEQALPGLPGTLLRTLPPLSQLVASTRAREGTALRVWLDTRHASTGELADLLRSRHDEGTGLPTGQGR